MITIWTSSILFSQGKTIETEEVLSEGNSKKLSNPYPIDCEFTVTSSPQERKSCWGPKAEFFLLLSLLVILFFKRRGGEKIEKKPWVFCENSSALG